MKSSHKKPWDTVKTSHKKINDSLLNNNVMAEAQVSEGMRLREVFGACGKMHRDIASDNGWGATSISKWLSDAAKISPADIEKLIEYTSRQNPDYMTPQKAEELRDMVKQRRLVQADAIWNYTDRHLGYMAQALRMLTGKSLSEMGDVLGMSATGVKSREQNKPPIEAENLDKLIALAMRQYPQWVNERQALIRAEHARVSAPLLEAANPDIQWERAYLPGEYMQAARLASGLSQGALAQRMGITQAMISNWESGGYNPTREQLAEFMGIMKETIPPRHAEWWSDGRKDTIERAFRRLDIQEGKKLWNQAGTVVKRVQALRVASGMNQREFAQAVGMGYKQYQGKEQGRTERGFTPSELENVLAFCQVLIPDMVTAKASRYLLGLDDLHRKRHSSDVADEAWNKAITQKAEAAALADAELAEWTREDEAREKRLEVLLAKRKVELPRFPHEVPLSEKDVGQCVQAMIRAIEDRWKDDKIVYGSQSLVFDLNKVGAGMQGWKRIDKAEVEALKKSPEKASLIVLKALDRLLDSMQTNMVPELRDTMRGRMGGGTLAETMEEARSAREREEQLAVETPGTEVAEVEQSQKLEKKHRTGTKGK